MVLKIWRIHNYNIKQKNKINKKNRYYMNE